ncbi:TPA: UDP-N-acetylmuramate--L-alanine ligase [Patescibacteria group bacterium]|nr:MAG: UDP-N-acetylmuramate-L-alanine ligase [Parcubacteria group bacterium GW2011_GWA2_46_39]HCU47931.1 UDP-N-acetylmuramate--L-alanine ligase [Patescibacteria group bacterium]
MKLDSAQNIYMIGIKGQGMTGLALILKSRGKNVSGSDTEEKFNTDQVLRQANISFTENFKAANLPKHCDVVIYSSAYTDANPEMPAAEQAGLPMLSYAEALGELTKIQKSIAVAGTHGKTTITAMLAYVLEQAGLAPLALIGSPVKQFASNALTGSGELFVFEADEYQNKFNFFTPWAVVLTSIDWDHTDWFKTPDDYRGAFTEFLKKVPPDGVVVANYDSAEVKTAMAEAGLKDNQVISYGLFSGDWQMLRMWLDQGRWYFSVLKNNEHMGDFELQLVGSHNVANAIAVIALASYLGIDLDVVRRALADFEGTTRRFEFKGRLNNSAIVIDDYAHHPREIMATLKAARNFYPYKNIRVVFHPHTYSRTAALLKDFAKSFSDADEVVVLDIYASARETKGDITSQHLVDAIKKHHPKVVLQPTIADAAGYLSNSLTRSDLVITMGAGDVWRVGDELIKKFGLMTGPEF